MKHTYGLRPDTEDSRDYVYSFAPTWIAPSVSFRKECPPIYDQLSLGSCTSNAWLLALKMWYKAQGLECNIDFSRLQHYFSERVLEGTVAEDAGAQMRTGGKVLQKMGVCHEELWPYIISDFAKQPSDEASADAPNHKIPAYKRLQGLTAAKQYLSTMAEKATPAAVVVGLKLFGSFESSAVKRTGVVPIPGMREEMIGCHAVAIIGYDNNKEFPVKHSLLKNLFRRLAGIDNPVGYCEVANSWGERWGDKGFFWLPYAYIRSYGFDYWVIDEDGV